MVANFLGLSILRYWFRVIGMTNTYLLKVVWDASAQSGSGGHQVAKSGSKYQNLNQKR